MYFSRISTLLATLTLLSATANASLVGNELLLEHRFETRNDASAVVTVEDGSSDIADMFLGNNVDGPVGYLVDVDSDSIFVDFYIRYSTHFSSVSYFEPGPPYMNGLLITGDSLDAAAFKASASISTEEFQFTQERIIVRGEHQIGLDFQSLEFNGRSSLRVTFSQPSSVPEPASMALVLIGLVSIASRHKARRI